MSETFPVSDYYGSDLIHGTTIAKNDAWWSAVLLIRDPYTETRYVALHRWAKSGGTWLRRGSYRLSNAPQITDAIRALEGYAERL